MISLNIPVIAGALIGATVAAGVIYAKGRLDGAQICEAAAARKTIEDLQSRNKTDGEIDRMSPDDRRDRLRDWTVGE